MGLEKLILFFTVGFPLLYLILGLVKFLQRLWWDPIRIKKALEAQGIRGPTYKFLHGNTREVAKMIRESTARSMDLSSHDIFPKVQPHLHVWTKVYGRNFLHWHGPKAQLVIGEPELLKEMLSNRDGAYHKTPATVYVKKLLGDGLAVAEGRKWARQRKLANRAFHAENLKGMTPAMVASIEIMLDKWREYEGREIDVFKEFVVLTSDVISRTAFGSSYVEGRDIILKLQGLAMIISRNFQTIRFPGIGKFLRNQDDIESDRLENEIRESIIKIIRSREEKKGGDPDGYGNDLLGLLLKANHEADNNVRITTEDLIDECKTFYVAGHETTTNLLSWTVFLLAVHTDWQEKARQEVIQVFGDSRPASSSDDTKVAKLKTMNMIINESLRLYPPAIWIGRTVAREVSLGKLILPADIEVVVSPLAVHSDPQIWGEDVHFFKPERFSQGVAKATNNTTTAFLPFGMGPRICVGQNFAAVEAKIALLMILQRYAFTLSPTYIHSPVQYLTTRPQHGLQVVLHKL